MAKGDKEAGTRKRKKTSDVADVSVHEEASRVKKSKVKREKKVEEGATPSKPVTPFRCFAREKRKDAQVTSKDKAFTAMLKDEWKTMEKSEKAVYKKLAAAASTEAVDDSGQGEPEVPNPAPEPESSEGSSRASRRKQFWEERRKAKAEAAAEGAGSETPQDGSGDAGSAQLAVQPHSAHTGTGNAEEQSWRISGGTRVREPRRRYLLFVGNMAYKTKLEDVYKHFGKFGGLIDVRMRTDKATKKFLGTCFIEYDSREPHGKALGLHHSKLCGRVINVELTVGGGGNDPRRKEKLKEKNRRHLGTGGPESINSIPLGERKPR